MYFVCVYAGSNIFTPLCFILSNASRPDFLLYLPTEINTNSLSREIIFTYTGLLGQGIYYKWLEKTWLPVKYKHIAVANQKSG